MHKIEDKETEEETDSLMDKWLELEGGSWHLQQAWWVWPSFPQLPLWSIIVGFQAGGESLNQADQLD